jgi:hypothetical protein
MEVHGCYRKSLVAIEVTNGYGKIVIFIESPWLLWKSLVAFASHWVLNKYMAVLDS